MTLLCHSELDYNTPEKSELFFGNDGHVQARIERRDSRKGSAKARPGPGLSCTLRSPFTPASTLMLSSAALPASGSSSGGQVEEVGACALQAVPKPPHALLVWIRRRVSPPCHLKKGFEEIPFSPSAWRSACPAGAVTPVGADLRYISCSAPESCCPAAPW